MTIEMSRAASRASEFMNQTNPCGEVHLPGQHTSQCHHDVVAEAIQACGATAEEATQAVRQMSRIGGFVIERPETMRETMEDLTTSYNFEDWGDTDGQPDHVRQLEELERERQEARAARWELENRTAWHRIENRICWAITCLGEIITRPMRDHRARVKEQVRLDALPNPLRNPCRDVRV